MKYSEQNHAVAKLAGWKYEAPPVGGVSTACWYHEKVGWRPHVPLYVLGESTIQPLIERLVIDDAKRADYARILFKIMTGRDWPDLDEMTLKEAFQLSQARCDQKAEALLKTFNAWTS